MQRARRDRGDPKVRIGEHSLGRREYVEDQASPRGRRVERVGQTSERGALSRKASTVSIIWRAERARRSSFQTSASPSRTDFMAWNRAVDRCSAGDMLSEDLFRIRFGQRLSVARGSDRQ